MSGLHQVDLIAEEDRLTDSEVWDQMEGEPVYWYAKFCEYRLLGPSRTLKKIYRIEKAKNVDAGVVSPEQWTTHFTKWSWKARAEAWDVQQQEELEDEIEQIVGEGLASAHRRVDHLKSIAMKLEEYMLDPRTTRISPNTIEQYRGLLDDIAREQGHRVKETRLTGPKGGSVIIETQWGRGGSASSAWERNQLPAPASLVVETTTEE